jgi:hypothetical protein
MKRIYLLTFVLFAVGIVRGDASITLVQDPLVVNFTNHRAQTRKRSRPCHGGDA